MSQSYSAAHHSDVDRVRTHSGDTNVPNAVLEDETIADLLTQQSNYYYAAAEAVRIIAQDRGGLKRAEHAESTFEWMSDSGAIQAEIDRLNRLGAELANGGSGLIFRTL